MIKSTRVYIPGEMWTHKIVWMTYYYVYIVLFKNQCNIIMTSKKHILGSCDEERKEELRRVYCSILREYREYYPRLLLNAIIEPQADPQKLEIIPYGPCSASQM